MDIHGPNSDHSSQPGSASAAVAAAAAHRWYTDGGARMEPSGNMLVPDEMDVFFHSMSDGSGNHVNPATYYASPAAAAAAARAAVHSYRPSPHGKQRPDLSLGKSETLALLIYIIKRCT